MRRLWPVLLVLAVGAVAARELIAAPSSRKVLPREDRRFGHQAHAELVAARGLPRLSCDSACHQPSSDGASWQQGWNQATEHGRCFDRCHADARPRQMSPRMLAGAAGRVCYPCHGDKMRYVPETLGAVARPDKAELVTVYSHSRHMGASQQAGNACETCHTSHSRKSARRTSSKQSSHEKCVSCHDGQSGSPAPAIDTCSACHARAGGAPDKTGAIVPSPATPYAVTAAFDHARHERLAGKAGRACLVCHDNLIKATDGAPVPRPTMEGCRDRCHDGNGAFDALSNTCTRCHVQPRSARAASAAQQGQDPPRRAAGPAEPTRYRHAAHGERGVDQSKCRACHALDARFAVEPPTQARPHQPCVECHAQEFFAQEPRICGACHDGSEPWVAHEARLLPRSTPELAAVAFSHARHLAGAAADGPQRCAECHQGTYTAAADTSSHQRCAPCHDKSKGKLTAAGEVPVMERCEGCHATPGAAGSPMHEPSEWQVTSRFTHGSHSRDPRTGRATECTICHERAAGADSLALVGRPTMKSCAACHDGTHAFKTTGFGCRRCHGRQAP